MASTAAPEQVEQEPDTRSPRDRWLDARKQVITATDAGAILGVSKFASPIDVYLDKIGQRPAIVQTPRMEAGNRMQRPIIDWWAERERVDVTHAEPFTLTGRPGSRLAASLDATTTARREPVDAKNVGWKSAEWGDEGSDRIPLGYAVQLVVQMFVTGADAAFLPTLFGGHELVGYVLERDPDLEASIIEQCEQFWNNYVATETPPPVDGSRGWSEFLARTFAAHTTAIVRAGPQETELALHYAATLEQAAAVEQEADRLKNQLKQAIGDAAAIEGPGWKATWNLAKDAVGTDWEGVTKALALEYAARTGEPATRVVAELVAQHQTVMRKGSRRFIFSHGGAA